MAKTKASKSSSEHGSHRYRGNFIQYAVWAPLSADPADVTVTVSPDRTSLTILTASQSGTVRGL